MPWQIGSRSCVIGKLPSSLGCSGHPGPERVISDWKGTGNRVGARTAIPRQCRARMDRLETGRTKIGLKLGIRGYHKAASGAFCAPHSPTCMACSRLGQVPLQMIL